MTRASLPISTCAETNASSLSIYLNDSMKAARNADTIGRAFTGAPIWIFTLFADGVTQSFCVMMRRVYKVDIKTIHLYMHKLFSRGIKFGDSLSAAQEGMWIRLEAIRFNRRLKSTFTFFSGGERTLVRETRK